MCIYREMEKVEGRNTREISVLVSCSLLFYRFLYQEENNVMKFKEKKAIIRLCQFSTYVRDSSYIEQYGKSWLLLKNNIKWSLFSYLDTIFNTIGKYSAKLKRELPVNRT